MLAGLELSLLKQDFILHVFHVVACVPVLRSDSSCDRLLSQVVEMPALVRPVQHSRADSLEQEDSVRVVTAVSVVVDADRRVEICTYTELQAVVAVEEAARYLVIEGKILRVVLKSLDLILEATLVNVVVNRDVITFLSRLLANLLLDHSVVAFRRNLFQGCISVVQRVW